MTAKSKAPVRPEPPGEPGKGYHWEPAEDTSKDWALAQPGKTCRWRGSGEPRACGRSAVLRRLRGVQRRIWWNYCDDHAGREYGHWAEDGKVMFWKRKRGTVS